MRDYIVTEITYGGIPLTAAAFYEDSVLTGLTLERKGEDSMVSRVYRGTVESVSANIGGAFVDIGGTTAFLPLTGKEKPRVSAPVCVQVVKDASGVKQPVVTRNIHLQGKYIVLSSAGRGLSFSKKLTNEQKEVFRKWLLEESRVPQGLLVRTNAVTASRADFLGEAAALEEQMGDILRRFEKASSGSLLYSPEPFYIPMLRDAYAPPDRVMSDIPGAAAALAATSGMPEEEILFIQGNRALSLPQLCGLPDDLAKLTGKRVWLRSGAYLVIEKTEAFISIDVNTGKCAAGRIPEETYRKINLEAAWEVARQMRLRNLSGMILVDFISLRNPDHRKELTDVMRKAVRADHTHTEVVDLTPLGIMEIVRQKMKKPLEEILSV